MTAKLLTITTDQYFALDAFSQTAAKTLLKQSPEHARLGYRKPATKAMDRGSVIHRLVLGTGKDYEVIHHENFLTKAAKEKRDAARAAGKVPVLAGDMEEYAIAAEAIRVKLADRDIHLDGVSEQAITWVEHTEFGDVTCRGMFDHVWIERGMILDLKITEDASPMQVEKTAEAMGYGIQHAAYTRALEALNPSLVGKVGMAFAFCEPDEPHAMNLSEPGGAFIELGMRRWLRAVREWARCLRDNRWPSYGEAVNTITVPPWALSREAASADER